MDGRGGTHQKGQSSLVHHKARQGGLSLLVHPRERNRSYGISLLVDEGLAHLCEVALLAAALGHDACLLERLQLAGPR